MYKRTHELKLDARRRLPLAKVLPKGSPRRWTVTVYPDGAYLLAPVLPIGYDRDGVPIYE